MMHARKKSRGRGYASWEMKGGPIRRLKSSKQKVMYRRRACVWDFPDLTSPKAARLKVKVENSKSPIRRPFTYITSSLGVCGDVVSSHLFSSGLVTSRICPVLGQLNGYNSTTVTVTTGPNRANCHFFTIWYIFNLITPWLASFCWKHEVRCIMSFCFCQEFLCGNRADNVGGLECIGYRGHLGLLFSFFYVIFIISLFRISLIVLSLFFLLCAMLVLLFHIFKAYVVVDSLQVYKAYLRSFGLFILALHRFLFCIITTCALWLF
jgi:hypothetical protein